MNTGSDTWILNPNMIEKMIKADNKQKFTSPNLFVVGQSTWQIRIYPNGDKKSNKGAFKVNLALLPMPSELRSITISRSIWCSELGVRVNNIVTYNSNKKSNGWPSGSLKLREIVELYNKNELQLLTINIFVRILKITYYNVSAHYAHIIARKKQRIKWVLDKKLLNLMKDSYNGKRFGSVIYENKWSLSICPWGNRPQTNAQFQIFIQLCGLPLNINKLEARYRVFIAELNISTESTAFFAYNQPSFPWTIRNILPTDDFLSYTGDALTIIVDIITKQNADETWATTAFLDYIININRLQFSQYRDTLRKTLSDSGFNKKSLSKLQINDLIKYGIKDTNDRNEMFEGIQKISYYVSVKPLIININIGLVDNNTEYLSDILSRSPYNYDIKSFNNNNKDGLSIWLQDEIIPKLYNANDIDNLNYDTLIITLNGNAISNNSDLALELPDNANDDDEKYENYNDLREIFNLNNLSKIPKIYLIHNNKDNKLIKKNSPQDFSITYFCKLDHDNSGMSSMMKIFNDNYNNNLNIQNDNQLKELFTIFDIDVDLDRKFILKTISDNVNDNNDV